MPEPKWAWSSVDHPDRHYPQCDRCTAFARWSVARGECDADPGAELVFVTRWFACGVHLNRVLSDEEWGMDVVHVYDLTHPPERS